MPRTPSETADMVRSIAAAVHRVDAGEAIARDIEKRAERVQRDALGKPPVRFAYLIWRNPWMIASGDTFVSKLLELSGGTNVFPEGAERYPTVAPQDIADRSPDLVLLSSEPFPFKEQQADELSALTGLPRERFCFVDGELLSWHGSRTPAGIDYAESVIRGSLRAGEV
jgi:iron complex transport system substrate-binding protein